MTMIYDIVSRLIVSGAYLLYYFFCVDLSWDGGVVHTILGHFDLGVDF